MKRRDFLKHATTTSAAALGLPTLIGSAVFAQTRPNEKIRIGQIGCGRIARTHDLVEVLKHDQARVVAVADFDIHRARDTKGLVERHYAKATGKEHYLDVKAVQDYRELIADPSLDAVVISTPDHWHAQPAIEAALAGKDVYMQKPASLTIAEGRMMSDIVAKTGCVFQIGSQQRSLSPWPQFHHACQLVRNGRIGAVRHVEVGLGTDPGCGVEPEMPVPANLDYNAWLGSTPEVYYTEKRVHPQQGIGRPGWLRCRQFGAGMITGWGAHHIDTAHWGLGVDRSGPIELEGEAVFPTSGLWNVHGDFTVHTKYANGVTMEISSRFPNGVRWIGSEGWIFVSRGSVKVTASDPEAKGANKRALDASDRRILASEIGPDEIHLYRSPEQHLDWLNAIRTRRDGVAPAEIAHRSCSTCLLSHIAMQLRRKLYWDPDTERFSNDAAANAMLSRPQRKPYGTTHIKV